MQINEVSQLSPSQYAQFLPKQRFNIPKSTIQKVKSTITSLNSGIVNENFSQSQSTPYAFVVGANNMSVIDMSQMYFNIAGELEFPKALNATSRDIVLGNLFTASLFQNAQLELGGATIAMNANPGIDANMQAMLKFDFQDLKNYSLTDRQFMLNYVDKDVAATEGSTITFAVGALKVKTAIGADANSGEIETANNIAALKGCKIYWIDATSTTKLFYTTNDTTNFFRPTAIQMTFDDDGKGTGMMYGEHGGTTTAEIANTEVSKNQFTMNNVTVYSTDDVINNADSNSVFPNVTSAFPHDENTTRIPFRCKLYLSDLFNYTVDSLDYVFNREIKITLTRSATSNIIANIISLGAQRDTAVAKVAKTTKFELICYSYLLTDTARQQLIQYYSQPIETLYGIQTTNLTPLYQNASATEQTITLPLTLNYDTKAIILAFPKCSNALVPMSTNPKQMTQSQMTATNVTNDGYYQPSWFYSNSNSYNYGGLRYIRISNTNNSSIYTYDFQGTELVYGNPTPFNKSFDYTNSAANAAGHELDYREAYNQYKQLRLLFGKSPENGIDYYDFLKDYCIIPIDLAGTNIPPNTRIMVTFQFASWASTYNPLNYGNVGVISNEVKGKQMTTNLLAIFLGSDVLAYNPDGTCTVKHVLSANPMEKNVNLV